MPPSNDTSYDPEPSKPLMEAWKRYNALIDSGFSDTKYETLLRESRELLSPQDFTELERLIQGDLRARAMHFREILRNRDRSFEKFKELSRLVRAYDGSDDREIHEYIGRISEDDEDIIYWNVILSALETMIHAGRQEQD